MKKIICLSLAAISIGASGCSSEKINYFDNYSCEGEYVIKSNGGEISYGAPDYGVQVTKATGQLEKENDHIVLQTIFKDNGDVLQINKINLKRCKIKFGDLNL